MLLVDVWAKLLETCIRYNEHILFLFMCFNMFGCFMSSFSSVNNRIFPMTVIDNFPSFSTQPAPFYLLLWLFVFICNFTLNSHGGVVCMFDSSPFLLYSLITDSLFRTSSPIPLTPSPNPSQTLSSPNPILTPSTLPSTPPPSQLPIPKRLTPSPLHPSLQPPSHPKANPPTLPPPRPRKTHPQSY